MDVLVTAREVTHVEASAGIAQTSQYVITAILADVEYNTYPWPPIAIVTGLNSTVNVVMYAWLLLCNGHLSIACDHVEATNHTAPDSPVPSWDMVWTHRLLLSWSTLFSIP